MTSALKANGSTTQWRKIRLTILQRDQYTCRWCGRPANTVDHLHPRSLGGDDNPDNLVAACSTCNSSRGNGNRTRRTRTRTPRTNPQTRPISLTSQPAPPSECSQNPAPPSTPSALFPQPEQVGVQPWGFA